MKLLMKYTSYGDCRGSLECDLDGKYIGGGGFGGEPEDNMRERDYDWVEPLIAKLAKALGAEVECVEVEDED